MLRHFGHLDRVSSAPGFLLRMLTWCRDPEMEMEACMTGLRQHAGAAILAALLTVLASAPAVAQADLQAIDRRMSQFSAKGNYAAALVEAKKLEAAAKARYGIDHEIYAT